jgi:hypothetical protein
MVFGNIQFGIRIELPNCSQVDITTEGSHGWLRIFRIWPRRSQSGSQYSGKTRHCTPDSELKDLHIPARSIYKPTKYSSLAEGLAAVHEIAEHCLASISSPSAHGWLRIFRIWPRRSQSGSQYSGKTTFPPDRFTSPPSTPALPRDLRLFMKLRSIAWGQCLVGL